jgi:hypothetical protein
MPFLIQAQEIPEMENHYLNLKYSETAINVTGILQTIPLFTKTIDFRATEPTFVFKWAISPRRPRALRLGIGALLTGNGDGSKLYFSIGTERTRQVFRNFYIFTGLDLFFSAQEEDSSGLAGLGILIGMKYDIAKQISIYTESKMIFASDLDIGGTVIDLRPPTSIYVGYRFYHDKKKRKRK